MKFYLFLLQIIISTIMKIHQFLKYRIQFFKIIMMINRNFFFEFFEKRKY